MTRVSVAMAVRDVAPWLDEALDSVLDQLGPDDEVVVVDDGSTDATADLLAARGDGIVHIRQPPVGLGAARNRGLDECSGRYVGFLDGDDRWAPGALDHLLAGLEAYPDATGVIGRADEFLDPAVTDRAAAGLRAPARGAIAHLLGAMLFRREAFAALRFDPAASAGSSADWFGRARHHGLHLEPLEVVTLQRRLRPGSLTTDAEAYQAALLGTLRADLARRRRP